MNRVFAFSGWELRPAERSLLIGDQPVLLGSRAFDVLLALVERVGRVATKDELLSAAWRGVVVEENNLSVQIASLRKLLPKSTIRTVPGVGYQLVDTTPDPVFEQVERRSTSISTRPVAVVGARTQSALVGRAADLAATVEMVGRVPLVTIVGAGGVGKTALARELFADLVRANDAYWVDLSALEHGQALYEILANALGCELSTQSAAGLGEALAGRSALIVLDNCEHLIEPVARFVSNAIDLCATVRWLATSQEPLNITGEHVFRLLPLEVPEPSLSIDAVRQSPCVELLKRRAGSADSRLEWTDEDIAIAARICRQLDGLPLAIELVAARIPTMGLKRIESQLGRKLHLFTGQRHTPVRQQSLAKTFEWSYSLLSEAEQEAFRRLHVFVGGFHLDMAIAMVSNANDTSVEARVRLFFSLADKSLVHRIDDDGERFKMFESARDYARELAVAHAELDSIAELHARLLSDHFEGAIADFPVSQDGAWISRHAPERSNALVALRWACQVRHAEIAARLVVGLVKLDGLLRQPFEVRRSVVPTDLLEEASPTWRASALLELSWAHYVEGSRVTGAALASQALADLDETENVDMLYRALAQLIRLYESQPGRQQEAARLAKRLEAIDLQDVSLRTQLTARINMGYQFTEWRTVERLKELERIARHAGFDALASVCRTHVTDQLNITGRFDEAAAAARTFLDRGEPYPRSRALIRHNYALALIRMGRYLDALDPALAAACDFPALASDVAELLAFAAAKNGCEADAALIAGFCDRQCSERAEWHDPAEAALADETRSLIREALDAQRIDRLILTGAHLSPQDVLDLGAAAIRTGAMLA